MFNFFTSVISQFLSRNTVQISGQKVYLNLNDHDAARHFKEWTRTGRISHATLQRRFIVDSINENEIVNFVDVGASYGLFTFDAAGSCRANKFVNFISIEANPQVFEYLQKSVNKNTEGPNILPLNLAISDGTVPRVEFEINEQHSEWSKLAQPGQRTGTSITVDCCSLDSLLSDKGVNLSEKFVVKIDTEGSEPLVFEGMNKFFQQAQGYVILFEFHTALLNSLSPNGALSFARNVLNIAHDYIIEIHEPTKNFSTISNENDFSQIIERANISNRFTHVMTNIALVKNMKVPDFVSINK